jgi:hypothetical protein
MAILYIRRTVQNCFFDNNSMIYKEAGRFFNNMSLKASSFLGW